MSMRFNYLNLRAFGHFTNYEIEFDKTKNFHFIYGLNEAGKSTTLRSIHHFLYGFPQQTPDAFLHSNANLRIEGELQKKNGDTFRFVRRKGKKNTIVAPNGEPLNEEVVEEYINEISEQHFSKMFALNHVTLREGGESLLASGGSLGESLFSAASGVSKIRQVFEQLEKQATALYNKRGRNQLINKLVKEEKDLKKEIAEYQLKIQSWKELERQFNDGIKGIEHIIHQEKLLRSKRDKLERMKLILPKIAKLNEVMKNLDEIGTVPMLPENIEELRKDTIRKLDMATKTKQSAEENLLEIDRNLKQIIIPEGLLEHAALIDTLYRELQSYQNNLKKLPVLEGERKQLEVRLLSFMKEIDPLHADIEKIDLYRLPAEKKERIRELCKQKPLLDQAFEQNEIERQNIKRELEENEEKLKLIPQVLNTEQLEVTIEKIKSEGQLEETLKKLKAEMEEKEQKVNEAVSMLPNWDRSVEELVNLQLRILKETINRFEQQQNDIIKQLEKTEEQINNQKETIAAVEKEIRNLEVLSEIPTEEKLLAIRKERDKGWQLIRRKLEIGEWEESLVRQFTHGEKIETKYENLIQKADHFADQMINEAEKIGAKKKHLADIEICEQKIATLENKKSILEQELAKWEEEWKDLWKQSKIDPLSPQEMKEWLFMYEQIKKMYEEYEKVKNAIHEYEQKLIQLKELLVSTLLPFTEVNEKITLGELLKIAEKQLRYMKEIEQQRKRFEDLISGINHRINTNALKNKEIVRKLENWRDSWINAIKGTYISETTSVDVAEKLLQKFDDCSHTYDELVKIENELHALQKQLVNYEEKMNQLLAILNIPRKDQAVEIVVNQLYAQLQQAMQDEVLITNLKDQAKKIQETLKGAEKDIEDAEVVLSGLLKRANTKSLKELEEIEKLFLLKRDFEHKKEEIEEQLLELGGGKTLSELIEDAQQFEYDSIDAEIAEINKSLTEIERDRSNLEQAHGAVKKEYEEKIQGNSTLAIEAEQKKKSILATLANLTEKYIELKLASLLLQKGIEFYRNQSQDPILKRAGDLFARLTLQSFSGLTVDYDEKDQPILMGVRKNGSKVSINGMSDGTTDQLYLSLRIASIMEYCEQHEPIPFIVDDILVHFDDVRSKETLKILLELSKETQIIFFTHHYRLVEIMQEIADGHEYQLTELHLEEIGIH